jgi:hypothetical protein
MADSVGLDAQAEEAIIETTSRGVNRVELQLAAQAQISAEAEASLSGLHGGP